MRVVVTGLIGQYAFGGVIWDYLQYVLGFGKLGHDVYYLEDTGAWPYSPELDSITDDCSYQVELLGRVMGEFDLGDRWLYRNGADGRFHGVGGEKLARELVKSADLLVNVSHASWFEDYEIGVRHMMFIDGDPMFTQIGMMNNCDTSYVERLRAHHSHFTFGLKVGEPDCRVPTAGIDWKKTLQPVHMESWPMAGVESNDRFTTVMNWASYDPIEWQGESYGQKGPEFERFRELPQRVPQKFRLAMGQGVGRARPTESLCRTGWEIVEPPEVIPDHHAYRQFLSESKAEWSVAKEGYVKARTGWFSCRTACYLALGRPALVQETGWSDVLGAGEGLLAFQTLEDCVRGVEAINADYERHRHAARAFAEKHLESSLVCSDLLEQAGLGN